jgi:hypothetical protein
MLFAGYNAVLLMVVGALMVVGDSLPGSHVWFMCGGILLLILGLLFFVGGFGFCGGRVWARKVLFWCFAVNLPLLIVAIFPIFQNDRMTTGNTLLQTACIVASLLILKDLAGARMDASADLPPARSLRDEMPDGEEDAAPFTFDRNHKGDDPFP